MSTTVAASPAVVTGLTNDSAYYFTVTARNSVGSSLPANSNTVTPTGSTAKTLADTGAGADAGPFGTYFSAHYQGYLDGYGVGTAILSDTAAGTDAFVLGTVAIARTDTGTVADAISVNQGTPKSLSDTGAATDVLALGILCTLPDICFGTDALSITTAGTLRDAGTGADAFNLGTPKALADTGVGVEAFSSSAFSPVAPSPVMQETLEWVDPDGMTIPLTQRISGKGRWMPPVKIVSDHYAGQSGSRARQVTLDTASVLVPILVTSSDVDVYRGLIRAMSSSLNPLRGPGKLRATLTHADASVTVREMAAYYTAGMDFPEDQLDVGYPSLLFNSEGPPYWTDATDTTVTYSNNATAYTWFPIGGSPWTPLILNQSTIFAQDTVINDGDAPVYPIWSLTGPASGVIQLDNLTTDKSLWFNYIITTGQNAVVIDTRPGTKSITQGPVSLYRYLMAWDMWPLEPGRNDIVLTVPGATAATKVSRTYRRGFLAA